MSDPLDAYLPRPAMPSSDALLDAFEHLYRDRIVPGAGRTVDYPLREQAPVWQFLCWLGDTHDVVLHGSGTTDIAEFEPRLPGDTAPWAHRELVFATNDGIWSMFYAVLDRSIAWSLSNAAFSLGEHDDGTEIVRYFFSINDDAHQQAWSSPGTVYVLPRTTFEPEPDEEEDGVMVYGRQWASVLPVRPLASIPVHPEDFPFLDSVLGHEVPAEARAERARRGAVAGLD